MEIADGASATAATGGKVLYEYPYGSKDMSSDTMKQKEDIP